MHTPCSRGGAFAGRAQHAIRGIRALLLAGACLLALVESAPGQMQEDYRFKGRFVDTQGQPLGKVHATFRNVETGARIEFSSRDDGTFDRRMIPAGSYEVQFEKPGYLTRVEQFHWVATANRTILKEAEIVLESQGSRAARELDQKSQQMYKEAYAALESNDCNSATAKGESLLALGAGDREYAVRFLLGRCRALAGENQAAAVEYAQVVALKPDLFEAHFDYAAVLEKLGDHDRALAEYSRAAELNPRSTDAQYNIGAIHFARQELDAATVHLEKAIALDSTFALAHKVLGFTALQTKPADSDRRAAKADALSRTRSHGRGCGGDSHAPEGDRDDPGTAQVEGFTARPEPGKGPKIAIVRIGVGCSVGCNGNSLDGEQASRVLGRDLTPQFTLTRDHVDTEDAGWSFAGTENIQPPLVRTPSDGNLARQCIRYGSTRSRIQPEDGQAILRIHAGHALPIRCNRVNVDLDPGGCHGTRRTAGDILHIRPLRLARFVAHEEDVLPVRHPCKLFKIVGRDAEGLDRSRLSGTQRQEHQVDGLTDRHRERPFRVRRQGSGQAFAQSHDVGAIGIAHAYGVCGAGGFTVLGE